MSAATLATDAALVLLVATAWLGALGFARLRAALDRLHAAPFISAGAGFFLLVAGVLTDGASVRVAKIVLILLASLLAGAASSHAIGRALLNRRSVPDAERGERAA